MRRKEFALSHKEQRLLAFEAEIQQRARALYAEEEGRRAATSPSAFASAVEMRREAEMKLQQACFYETLAEKKLQEVEGREAAVTAKQKRLADLEEEEKRVKAEKKARLLGIFEKAARRAKGLYD